jgi:hypothetical protein
MTLRIGVTGHRVTAHKGDLAAVVGGALQLIKNEVRELHAEATDLYDQGEPLLRIVSAIAEGADRLVAVQGQALGFELECPLPFCRSQYELDFETEAPRAEFHRLLAGARSVRELDGCRGTSEQRSRAYEAAGRTVLRNCDLLLAVWDGRPPGGVGGTGQIVGEALDMNLPVVWIKAAPPHQVVLLESRRGTEAPGRVEKPFARTDLAARLRPLLLVPRKVEAKAAKRYFRERWPRGRPGLLYDLFRRTMSWPGVKPAPKAQETTAGWGDELTRDQPRVSEQIEERYGLHAAWADALANHYAGLYRSSTVALYLMGAAAVLLAFFGVKRDERPWFLGELCILLAIVSLTFLGRKRCWHERWIEYRVLAEELRQVQLLALLARVTSSFQVPAHLAQHEPSQTWFTWHFRAVVRQAGLIGARIDAAYLAVCERVLARVVQSQINYYGQRQAELGHMRRRLHHTGQGLFALAGLACILHWRLHLQGPPGTALSFASLVLPAFAAALGAIASQGELERIEARSGALHRRLELLARQRGGGLSQRDSNELGRAAQEFADVLLAELVDWRFVFLGKSIELPA